MLSLLRACRTSVMQKSTHEMPRGSGCRVGCGIVPASIVGQETVLDLELTLVIQQTYLTRNQGM